MVLRDGAAGAGWTEPDVQGKGCQAERGLGRHGPRITRPKPRAKPDAWKGWSGARVEPKQRCGRETTESLERICQPHRLRRGRQTILKRETAFTGFG